MKKKKTNESQAEKFSGRSGKRVANPEEGRRRGVRVCGEPIRTANQKVLRIVCPEDDDGQPALARVLVQTQEGAPYVLLW